MNWARRVAQLRDKAAEELRRARIEILPGPAPDAPPFWNSARQRALEGLIASGLGDDAIAHELGTLAAAIATRRALCAAAPAPEESAPPSAVGPAAAADGGPTSSSEEVFWTEARKAELARLVGAGVGDQEIARRLGTSRMAVIGKRNRLCLLKREKSTNLQLDHIGVNANNGTSTWHPLGVVRERLPRIETCQRPKGNPPKLDFCGKPVTTKGSPYCDECRAECFVKPRKKSAAELLAGVRTEGVPARRRVA